MADQKNDDSTPIEPIWFSESYTPPGQTASVNTPTVRSTIMSQVVAQEANRRGVDVKQVMSDRAYLTSDVFRDAVQQAYIASGTATDPTQAMSFARDVLGAFTSPAQPEGTKAPAPTTSRVPN